jgi:adenylate kinase
MDRNRGGVPLDLVILGGPGSGKGTQADFLRVQFNVPHVSTGDLFRESIKNETELGRTAKEFMDRGELVPDAIVDVMVRDRLHREDARNGFILDGFPRTLAQAKTLNEIMEGLRRQLQGVLFIRVSDDEIVERISGRLICQRCQDSYHVRFKPPKVAGVCDVCGGELFQRPDDNPEALRERLRAFHTQSEPLIEYYAKAGLLREVNGEGDVAVVNKRILVETKKLLKFSC